MWVGDEKIKKILSFLADRANMVALKKMLSSLRKTYGLWEIDFKKWNTMQDLNLMSEKYN